jgi:hypothetical protein
VERDFHLIGTECEEQFLWITKKTPFLFIVPLVCAKPSLSCAILKQKKFIIDRNLKNRVAVNKEMDGKIQG